MVSLLVLFRSIILNIIDIYRLILVVYFLMSWLPGAYQSTLGQLLIRVCEPYVGFFRRFIPPIGFISIAGIAAYFSLTLVEYGAVTVMNFLIRLFL